MTPWEYLPNEDHIKDIREFIKKYYKEEIYIRIKSVGNKHYYFLFNFQKLINHLKKIKYIFINIKNFIILLKQSLIIKNNINRFTINIIFKIVFNND